MGDALRGEKLHAYSTCDISDALLKLQCRRGGFIPGITMWSPDRQAGTTKIVGPAYTVKFVRKSDTDGPVLDTHHIDTVPSGAVIFLAVPKGVENAAYGGLMTHRAKYQGAVGTVVDGKFRDLEEQRKLGFPVFARDVATPPYYEVARPSEINVPITLQDGETTIQPGDLIVADLNGVVCIPRALETKVEEMLPLLREADEKVEADIQNGAKFAEASKKHRRI